MKPTLPSPSFLWQTKSPNDILWLVVFTFTAIISLLWLLIKTRTRSSKLPPGPTPLPLVSNLLSLDPELHSYFAGLLGIVITSPTLAREVLKDHNVTFANRDLPDVARNLTYGGHDIAWNLYGLEWRMLRKVCVLKMLSNTTLDSVYDLRRREIRNTVGYFYSRVGSPVKFGEQMFLTILNVITSMLWGGAVEGEERASIGSEFREVISEITELLGKSNVSDFFPGLARFDLQGTRKKMDGLSKRFDEMFERMINKRLTIEKEGRSKSNDFLEFLLKVKDEGDSKTPFTMTHVKALQMDMVVGGSDTSSNTIEFVMAEIMNQPEVMRKAQEEVEAVVGKEHVVEESHIHKLTYLQAVMKETLRLHPALPLLVPHCPSETCTIGGYTIPKGARVFINVWASQRDPSNWEDPLKFNLERFMNNSKWDFGGSDFNYLPFGSGRRICAGIAMAERMVLYSVATLLHSFDWEMPNGEKKTPLVAIPTPRLSDPALYE
ncbi:hypothetical protein UlMin_001261 [Ulmus minor]